MTRRVAVIQSNYLAWKGYFDIIHDVDLFVFYDDVQYTKNDWRNRNKIKTAKGLQWITIPVGSHIHRLICDVEITHNDWQRKHWEFISNHYGGAPHFARYEGFFRSVYLENEWRNLSQLNQWLIRSIARDFLGIRTEFGESRQYNPEGERQDRLLDLLRKVGADYYVSGPAAKKYIEPRRFEEMRIGLGWKSYSGYPEYPQPFPPFEHGVSIIDVLFNVGPDAPYYIWGWREAAR